MVLLIHPALDTFIRRQRTRTPFVQFQHIRVGDNLEWQPHFAILMQIEKQLHKIEDHQFVELAHQVVKRIQSLINSGTTPFARIEIETSEEWKTLYGQDADETLRRSAALAGRIVGRAMTTPTSAGAFAVRAPRSARKQLWLTHMLFRLPYHPDLADGSTSV